MRTALQLAWGVSSLFTWAMPALCPVHIGLDLAPAAVIWLERSIEFHEGADVEHSLPSRQHNPCALIYVGQRGAVRGLNSYAQFRTREAGKAACLADLKLKIVAGMDVGEILWRWNGAVYLDAVERETGLHRSDRFSFPPGDFR